MSQLKHTLDCGAGTLDLALDGDILSTNVERLRAEIFGLFDQQKAGGQDWNALNLDVSKAQMIDSAGLNLVVLLTKFARNRGSKMMVKVHNPNIHRTFLFTRLDKQLDLVLV